MFRRILVPLDGSKLAEHALGPAIRLAGQFGSAVLLLRVVVPETGRPARSRPGLRVPVVGPFESPARPSDPSEAIWEAEAYLAEVCARQAGAGLRFRTEVVAGTAPEVIVAVAESHAIDLIVMSTHGRSGLSRLVYGSVTEAVIRGGHRPVLVVPSTQSITQLPSKENPE